MLPLLCGLVAVLAGGRADVRRDGGGQWWEWGLRERNGVYVSQEGVAQLDGCTMRGNEDDDYHIYKGGCIEGVDQSLVNIEYLDCSSTIDNAIDYRVWLYMG